MNKSCLLIIDMQNGVFQLKNKVFDEEILKINTSLCINKAITKGMNIIFTQHENKTSFKKDSENWKLIDFVQTALKDSYVLHKKHPGIFKNTELLKYLQQNGIKDLYIAGLVSNGCVRAACLDSNSNGFNVFLILDCHSTVYKNAGRIITEVNNEMEAAGISLITTKSFVENCD